MLRHLKPTLLKAPGIHIWVKRRARNAVRILMYHGVLSKPLPLYNWCHLESDLFKKHLEVLTDEKFSIVPLREVIAKKQRGETLPERAACITFDDGFANIASNAAPLLQKLEYPYTIFVIAGHLDSKLPGWPDQIWSAFVRTQKDALHFLGKTFSLVGKNEKEKSLLAIKEVLKEIDTEQRTMLFDEIMNSLEVAEMPIDDVSRIMGWDQLKELAKSELCDIGSHTMNHPILSMCSVEQQHLELEQSKKILDERIGKTTLLAYPNGRLSDFTEETKHIAKEVGYEAAVTTRDALWKQENDLFAIPRIGVGRGMKEEEFLSRLYW